MASKFYVKRNMLEEFNEAGKAKTSHVKYSLEFNDFLRTKASAPSIVFEAIRQTLHIMV